MRDRSSPSSRHHRFSAYSRKALSGYLMPCSVRVWPNGSVLGTLGALSRPPRTPTAIPRR
jgi:hypothetical protein